MSVTVEQRKRESITFLTELETRTVTVNHWNYWPFNWQFWQDHIVTALFNINTISNGVTPDVLELKHGRNRDEMTRALKEINLWPFTDSGFVKTVIETIMNVYEDLSDIILVKPADVRFGSINTTRIAVVYYIVNQIVLPRKIANAMNVFVNPNVPERSQVQIDRPLALAITSYWKTRVLDYVSTWDAFEVDWGHWRDRNLNYVLSLPSHSRSPSFGFSHPVHYTARIREAVKELMEMRFGTVDLNNFQRLASGWVRAFQKALSKIESGRNNMGLQNFDSDAVYNFTGWGLDVQFSFIFNCTLNVPPGWIEYMLQDDPAAKSANQQTRINKRKSVMDTNESRSTSRTLYGVTSADTDDEDLDDMYGSNEVDNTGGSGASGGGITGASSSAAIVVTTAVPVAIVETFPSMQDAGMQLHITDWGDMKGTFRISSNRNTNPLSCSTADREGYGIYFGPLDHMRLAPGQPEKYTGLYPDTSETRQNGIVQYPIEMELFNRYSGQWLEGKWNGTGQFQFCMEYSLYEKVPCIYEGEFTKGYMNTSVHLSTIHFLQRSSGVDQQIVMSLVDITYDMGTVADDYFKLIVYGSSTDTNLPPVTYTLSADNVTEGCLVELYEAVVNNNPILETGADGVQCTYIQSKQTIWEEYVNTLSMTPAKKAKMIQWHVLAVDGSGVERTLPPTMSYELRIKAVSQQRFAAFKSFFGSSQFHYDMRGLPRGLAHNSLELVACVDLAASSSWMNFCLQRIHTDASIMEKCREAYRLTTELPRPNPNVPTRTNTLLGEYNTTTGNSDLFKARDDEPPMQANEQYLFHATTAKALTQIMTDHFDTDIGRSGKIYGKGAYFTDDPAKSHRYEDGTARDRQLLLELLGDALYDVDIEDSELCFMLGLRVSLGCSLEIECVLDSHNYYKEDTHFTKNEFFLDGKKNRIFYDEILKNRPSSTSKAHWMQDRRLEIHKLHSSLQSLFVQKPDMSASVPNGQRYAEFIVYNGMMALPTQLFVYKTSAKLPSDDIYLATPR
jgi:hypothetical protein